MITALLIPGLGDRTRFIEFLVRGWKREGVNPVVLSVAWSKQTESIDSKLEKLYAHVDQLSASGSRISVVGCSAGASLAVNLFFLRQASIERVICICGRLKVGELKGFRGFARRCVGCPAFAESVRRCEGVIGVLDQSQRQRILTVRARMGDELVPPATSTFPGLPQMELDTIGHAVSIASAFLFYSRSLTTFLKGEAK